MELVVVVLALMLNASYHVPGYLLKVLLIAESNN